MRQLTGDRAWVRKVCIEYFDNKTLMLFGSSNALLLNAYLVDVVVHSCWSWLRLCIVREWLNVWSSISVMPWTQLLYPVWLCKLLSTVWCNVVAAMVLCRNTCFRSTLRARSLHWNRWIVPDIGEQQFTVCYTPCHCLIHMAGYLSVAISMSYRVAENETFQKFM